MRLPETWAQTLSEIREKSLLCGGDLEKTMKGLFHGHPEAREQLTKRLLQELRLEVFSPFIEAPSFPESDQEKENLRECFQNWYEGSIDSTHLTRVSSAFSLIILDECKKNPISMHDGAEVLMLLFLLHEHSSHLTSDSEALIKEAIARILRHLIAFKQFGPLNVLTSKILYGSLTPDFLPALLSATKLSVRVGRELLDIALHAPTAKDYHLSLLHCYPFLTAAIEICGFCMAKARELLGEEDTRFCDQARKPLREVRDHTMGWSAWAHSESGDEMTFLVDNYRKEILEIAAKSGVETAKREAIFQCRTLHMVPLFALEEIKSLLESSSPNPLPE